MGVGFFPVFFAGPDRDRSVKSRYSASAFCYPMQKRTMRTTMHRKTILLFLGASFSQGVCAGEIYRCTAANGDVMFTNIACPSSSKAQQVASYVAEPDTPQAAPDPAAGAAAASAREARDAAAQAQAAAYQAAQAAYLQAEAAVNHAEAVSEQNANNDYGYPAWAASYPYRARPPRPEGHHRHQGDGKSAQQLPYPPSLPINTSLFKRHR
jgi:hypothetical protein